MRVEAGLASPQTGARNPLYLTGGEDLKGRHVRPRPNLLTRLRVVVARWLSRL